MFQRTGANPAFLGKLFAQYPYTGGQPFPACAGDQLMQKKETNKTNADALL